jgi:hypothetical protein
VGRNGDDEDLPSDLTQEAGRLAERRRLARKIVEDIRKVVEAISQEIHQDDAQP